MLSIIDFIDCPGRALTPPETVLFRTIYTHPDDHTLPTEGNYNHNENSTSIEKTEVLESHTSVMTYRKSE